MRREIKEQGDADGGDGEHEGRKRGTREQSERKDIDSCTTLLSLALSGFLPRLNFYFLTCSCLYSCLARIYPLVGSQTFAYDTQKATGGKAAFHLIVSFGCCLFVDSQEDAMQKNKRLKPEQFFYDFFVP